MLSISPRNALLSGSPWPLPASSFSSNSGETVSDELSVFPEAVEVVCTSPPVATALATASACFSSAESAAATLSFSAFCCART
ncbi:MAG: hypothetical protein MUC87_06490 [Bacteroidia bacterium]|nr:hypothetical protein [Bacteroidia bacterium]